jgi:hypothetical protein
MSKKESVSIRLRQFRLEPDGGGTSEAIISADDEAQNALMTHPIPVRRRGILVPTTSIESAW